MDDLLVLGSDREPSPWRRRLTVVAVLIVLAVVVVTHLPHKRETSRHPAATASAGPVQLAGLGSGAAGPLNQADRTTRQAPPATSPSTPGGRVGPPQHSTGHHNVHRCPQHTIMGASPEPPGSYCGAGGLL